MLLKIINEWFPKVWILETSIKAFADIRIRIRFPFESSFWISVSGCTLTILPDIQLANRIMIISAVRCCGLKPIWLSVCFGQKWWDAGQHVIFKQLGDNICKGNKPIVTSITYAPILVFINTYNGSCHAFLWNFSMHWAHIE